MYIAKIDKSSKYITPKRIERKVIISPELYDEIKQYENELINEKKYFKSIR